MKKGLIYFFFFVLIVNTLPIPIFLGLEPVINVYKYEGITGTEILEIPEKGRKIDFDSPGLKRKFKMHFWKVWKWGEYLTHERWKLEYTE